MKVNYSIVEYEELLKKYPDFKGVNRLCNICGYRFNKFKNFNKINPREAQCPLCGSLERHRHLAVHLFSLFPFLENKKILHFAPEQIIKDILKMSDADYFDADIDEKKARYKVDITDIKFNNDTFDYIICIHVLEHIIDDIKAMSELYRVLKPGGIAFLDVPYQKKLFEDYSIIKPEDREKAFGQCDHARWYDFETFTKRLKQVGFTLKISYASKYLKIYPDSKIGSNIVLASKL